jgi:hypothetical protein
MFGTNLTLNLQATTPTVQLWNKSIRKHKSTSKTRKKKGTKKENKQNNNNNNNKSTQ